MSYHYGIDKYGLIICTSVLHFFCDEIKCALICFFYKAIKKKGLIFIRLNHSKHPGDTNLKNSRKICHNIYQSKSDHNEIKYLIDSEEFIERMKIYNLVEKHILIDDKTGTLTIVIRK